MNAVIKSQHVKSLVTYQGGDLYSAALFSGGCKFPLLNLVGKVRDDVLANFPVKLGRINPGITQPVLIGQEPTFTTSVDPCISGEIDTDLNGCEWVVPEQKLIDFCSGSIPWRDTWQRFCNSRAIPSNQCPPALQPFGRDGGVNLGSPLLEDFMVYTLDGMANAYMLWLNRVGLTGDFANDLEIDGLYTQLRNGWDYAAGSGTCDEYNIAQTIAWDTITAASEDCDGNSNAGYAGAVIDPSTDVTFWLSNVTSVGGWGLAQILANHMDAVEDYTASRGGVTQWELHVPKGYKNCIIEAVSCLRVCCNAELDTEVTNDRYARLRRQNIVDLYPYRDDQIVMLETNELTDSIFLVPRMIGECETYAMVFDPVGDYFGMLAEVHGDFIPGMPNVDLAADPLIMETAEVLADNLETVAFGTSVSKEGDKCIRACINSVPTVIAYDRCVALEVTGIVCNFSQKPTNTPTP